MQRNSWKSRYKGSGLHRVFILKNILLKNNIESVILNKVDSSYVIFGFYEVFVHQKNYIEAIKILKKRIDFV